MVDLCHDRAATGRRLVCVAEFLIMLYDMFFVWGQKGRHFWKLKCDSFANCKRRYELLSVSTKRFVEKREIWGIVESGERGTGS